MSAVSSVTLYRQAVTLPLYPVEDRRPDAGDAAKIVAEIAERLEELNGIKHGLGADFVCQMACIANASRRGFVIVTQLLHGNFDEVLSSYQDQADKRGVTKQDIHYEFTHELAKLQRLYPQLYAVVMAMRQQATQHEDPISRGEVIAASAGGHDEL